MGQIFAYSLTVSLTLLLARGGYRLGHGGSPRMLRASLLAIYGLALIAVPAALNLSFSSDADNFTTPSEMPEINVQITSTEGTPLLSLLLMVYLAGVAVCLLLTLRDITRILLLTRGAHKITINAGRRVCVIDRDDIAPFSFGRIIVANRRDASNPIIMAHEAAHVNHAHTFDLLIAQAVAALCWYCPAAWQLRRDLRLVHEFQADAAVINDGTDSTAYSRLLVTRAAGLQNMAIANSFNYTNLKQRIKMMQTPLSGQRGGKFRALLPLAALVGAMTLLSVPTVSHAIDQISQTTLASRGLDPNASGSTFVIYGIPTWSDAIKQGNFIEVTDFEENNNVEFSDVDGVFFPRIQAIFCNDKSVLGRLAPGVKKYLIDGKVSTPEEFNKIPVSELRRVIISGNSMKVYTRNQTEEKYFNALETAVNAENQKRL